MHINLVQSQNQESYGSVNSKCTNNNTPHLHADICQAFTKLCVTTMGHLLSAGVGEFLSVKFYIFLLIKQEVKVAKC